MLSKFKDPISGLTHLLGAFLSLIGMIILINTCAIQSNTLINKISFSIFGLSLVLLYTASYTYHLFSVSDALNMLLRKIDHSMIYILIAGTYTPICVIALKGSLGFSLIICIWSLAIVGILMKIFWFNAPRWLYTLFYVVMGWLAIFAIIPLSKAIPSPGMFWLFSGGISYTIGALIYATKWPKIQCKLFGFHEIFHIFVLIGSFCHYWLMLKYVLYL